MPWRRPSGIGLQLNVGRHPGKLPWFGNDFFPLLQADFQTGRWFQAIRAFMAHMPLCSSVGEIIVSRKIDMKTEACRQRALRDFLPK